MDRALTPRQGELGEARTRCFEIVLSSHVDKRGRITIVEGEANVPFPIKRLYYLTEIAGGATRGSHAHRKLEQVMVAVTGSFDVYLNDGRNEWIHRLDRPDVGLYIGRYLWHEIRDCSAGAVCLMLASMPYDESDYIRDLDEFRALVKGAK